MVSEYLDELVNIELPRGCWLDLYNLLLGLDEMDRLRAFKLFEERISEVVE